MHRAYLRYVATGDEESALIARHADLISRLARRLAARTGYAVAADDLWSVGALGLLEAASRFDPGRDVRFESFAEHRIRGAMLDELRRMDHLPRRLRSQADSIETARARLIQSLGREPTSVELAEATKMGVEEIDAIIGVSQPHLRILPDFASGALAADEAVARAELRRNLTEAITALPERLQLVMSLHYQEALTYREIAHILDVSEPRVCQLHAEAITLLRESMSRADRKR